MRAAWFWITVSFVCSMIALILQIAILIEKTRSNGSPHAERVQYINTEPAKNAIESLGHFMQSLNVENLATPENGGTIRMPAEVIGDFMRSLEIGGGAE